MTDKGTYKDLKLIVNFDNKLSNKSGLIKLSKCNYCKKSRLKENSS